MLKKNDVIVFQGDSNTDANRNLIDPVRGTGYDYLGYAGMVPGVMNALYPDLDLTFYNRGVGGESIVDIRKRWKADCLDLHPTVVTLLAGINGLSCELDVFREHFIYFTESVHGIGAKFVLMEPFTFPIGCFRPEWRVMLDEKINILRTEIAPLADAFIPLDALFAQMQIEHGVEYCSPDGLHPTVDGQRMIAREVIKVFEEL